MSKGKKTAKEASVNGNPKPKKKNKTIMEHYPIEKYPGVNGEVFQIRIVDTGMAIHVEINLEYTDDGKEKTVHLRTDTHPLKTLISEVREKTKANLQAITIINRVYREAKIGDIFPMPKKKK